MLFNKDTFFPDVKVKSIYLRRELLDKVMAGNPSWVLQGVLPRASFRRQPISSQKKFTIPLHISNIYAKKHGMGEKLFLTIRAVMLDENVDLVAGDFNGAAWRCDNRNNISTIEEAFVDCALAMPPGRTPLWEPGSVPGIGLTFVFSSNRLNPIGTGKYGFMVLSPFFVMSWAE